MASWMTVLAAGGALAPAAALAAVLVGSAMRRPGRAGARARAGGTAFLFRDGALAEATPAARRMLDEAGAAGGGGALDRLVAGLEEEWGPGLGARLAALPPRGRLVLAAESGVGTLEAWAQGGALALALHVDPARRAALDALRLRAARDELATLRAIADDAPQPIWAVDPGGALAWANRAFLDLAEWPRPGDPPGAELAPPLLAPPGGAATDGPARRQLLVRGSGGAPRRLDVTSVRRGAGWVHFAAGAAPADGAPADGVDPPAELAVAAALAQAFAPLPLGVALFDRARRLVAANPALAEATGLPAPFLDARPRLEAVLDRLRLACALPASGGRATWREEVAAIEDAARRGRYCEAWALPGGQTWRVTARPHGEGGLMLLVEDVSDELALTRRFRSEIETVRGALDGLDEAVAVFSAAGTLSLVNAAYAALWGPPAGGMSDPGLADELARWEALAPSPLWGRLGARLAHGPREGGREGAEEVAGLARGGEVAVRAVALAQGATLLRFRAVAADPAGARAERAG